MLLQILISINKWISKSNIKYKNVKLKKNRKLKSKSLDTTTVQTTETQFEVNPVFNFVLNTLDFCTFTGSIFGTDE